MWSAHKVSDNSHVVAVECRQRTIFTFVKDYGPHLGLRSWIQWSGESNRFTKQGITMEGNRAKLD